MRTVRSTAVFLLALPAFATAQQTGGLPALREEVIAEAIARQGADAAEAAARQAGDAAESEARAAADADVASVARAYSDFRVTAEATAREAAQASTLAAANAYTDAQRLVSRPATTEECPHGGSALVSSAGRELACNGAPGPKGDTGAAGAEGQPGPAGPQGPAGSFEGASCRLPAGVLSTVVTTVGEDGTVKLTCGPPSSVARYIRSYWP